MSRWTRTVDLALGGLGRRQETWTAPDGTVHEVTVTLGKPLDVVALKDMSLDETREYEAFLRASAAALYAGTQPPRPACPCCGAPSVGAAEALRVFDVPYVRCAGCGHGYVRDQPPPTTLDMLFEESDEHSSTYTDPATLEVRLAQVVRPKVGWVLDVWAAQHGGRPATTVDVGAGGGHMVAGFREAGLTADGYELSASSRRFALDAFGIDLLADDFLTGDAEPVDLVTMWGLLEYTPDPGAFVAAALRCLSHTGMLVVEVPRFECIGTAAQSAPDAVVARHLDPTTHVNCFSDESLATVLAANGFRLVAAWYYGMDAYELAVQLALRAGGDETLAAIIEPLLALQPVLDEALACDDIVIAAVPA